MIKKSLLILLLSVMSITLSGCIPPFFDGGIATIEYFENSVQYTTFTVDASSENGFIESEAKTQALAYYTDGDENNIAMLNYRSFCFITKTEGIVLTSLAFILQAEEECSINITLSYGEEVIASDRFKLKPNSISTAYFSGLNIELQQGEKFLVLFTNPIEINSIKFRTDSYIFIGQEV